MLDFKEVCIVVKTVHRGANEVPSYRHPYDIVSVNSKMKHRVFHELNFYKGPNMCAVGAYKPDLLSPFWEDNLKEIVILPFVSCFNYFGSIVVYRIKPENFFTFFKNSKKGLEDNLPLKELLLTTYPNIYKMYASYSSQRVNDIINFFEPNTKEISYDVDLAISYYIKPRSENHHYIFESKSSAIDYLTNFERLLDNNHLTQKSVYMPYQTLEHIETFSRGYFGNDDNRVILGNINHQYNDTSLCIERSVLDIFYTDLRISILKSITSHLRNASVVNETIKANVHTISSKKNILNQMNEYLVSERLANINLLNEYSSIIEDFNSKFQKTFYCEYTTKTHLSRTLIKEWNFLDEEKEIYEWSYLTKQKNDFDKNVANVKHLIQTMQKKDDLIYNFIASYFSAKTTEANLKLQKAVKTLTWMTIVLSMMSILSSIFLEEIKSCLVKFFFYE